MTRDQWTALSLYTSGWGCKVCHLEGKRGKDVLYCGAEVMAGTVPGSLLSKRRMARALEKHVFKNHRTHPLVIRVMGVTE